MSNLTPVIKSIQDVMRQDAGINGDAQRIEQMVWLLFLKVFDALEEELELTRGDYKSPIPEHLRWRQWAADGRRYAISINLSLSSLAHPGYAARLSGILERHAVARDRSE